MPSVLRRIARRHFLFAMIPPFFLDCVIAIGLSISGQNVQPRTAWMATGFLVGQSVAEQKGQYRVFLVTCNHVIEDLTAAINDARTQAKGPISATPLIRFNPTPGGNAREYPFALNNWTTNSATDVAVAPINVDFLKAQGITNLAFFPDDQTLANRAKANDLGLSEGDGVYVLGFPLGLVEPGKQNFVIVRSGVIARIQDALAEKRDSFLIDSFAFPGNSGGPVITRPELFSITGTKSQNRSYVIGMMRDYVPYRDVAVSEQTKRPRIVFEENSGLADVIPIDDIQDAINTAVATAKGPMPASKPAQTPSTTPTANTARH